MIDNFYGSLFKSINNFDGVFFRRYEDRRSYADLANCLKKIISFLQSRHQERIVLFSDKSFESYGAIYGIILSGNVWVPMLSGQTDRRNLDILAMSEATLLLYDTPLSPGLEQYAIANKIKTKNLQDLVETVEVQDIHLPSFDPNDEAYVMFTSGSTGKPKGVPMTHLNYINFINNVLDILNLDQGDVFSDYHEFAFDISIFYLFCCPLVHGTIVPAITKAEKFLPVEFILQNEITVWASVPSVIGRIQQAFPSGSTQEMPIRIAFLCGEPFSLSVLTYCQDTIKIPEIFNFYGLTETGVENFYHHCQPDDAERYQAYGYVPIGLNLPGNDIESTEDKELLIAGCQVMPGYLQGIGTNKFIERDGKQWFKTGDIVEKHEGVWFCKGRLDSQVKISGYRIELMDIEVNLKQISGVIEAICFIHESGLQKFIVAVLKTEDGIEITNAELKQNLANYLPSYMFPKKIFITEDIPVNQNGKLDRKAIENKFSVRL